MSRRNIFHQTQDIAGASLSILLVERLAADGSTRIAKPMWLAFVGLKMPAVTEIWRLYLRRFVIDHWYRFAKNRLHWTVPQLRIASIY